MSSFSDYQSYEPGGDPYVALEGLRFNYTLRKLLFIGALLLGGFVALNFKDSFFYYLENRSGPVPLGDARAKYIQGDREIAPEHGGYVSLDNAIPTVYRSYVMERAGNERPYTEFLCPVFDVVVRTSRGLPSPPSSNRTMQVDSRLLPLLQAQRANIDNLNVRFSAEGRIYRMDKVAGEFSGLVSFYRPWIKKPASAAWILVDGDVPDVRILWVYIGIFLVIVFTGVLMLRARRALIRSTSEQMGIH